MGIDPTFRPVTTCTNTLGVYLTDGRLTIDNEAAEQAIRPLSAAAATGCTRARTAG